LNKKKNKQNAEPLTWGLLLCWLTNKSSSFIRYHLQSGLDVQCSAFVVNFNFSFSIGLRFRAGHYKIPAQQQALFVGRHSTFGGVLSAALTVNVRAPASKTNVVQCGA